MKIQYLGTAAAEGWPAVFCSCEHCLRAAKLGGRNIRTRSHSLIDGEISIDFPSDAYMHILDNKLQPWKWTALVVTHTHSDHFYPRDLGMRYSPFGHGVGKLNVYGNEKVVEALVSMIDGKDAARERTDVKLVNDFEPFTHGKYAITPLKADHDKGQNCHIYIFENGESSLLYANDTGYFPDETWDYIKNRRFDLVSLDCTNGLLPGRTGHMSLECCAEVKERMLSNGCDSKTQFAVNHFSHNGGAVYDEMAEMAAKYGMVSTYDGMVIEF